MCTVYVIKYCYREKINLEILTDIKFISPSPSDYEDVVHGVPSTEKSSDFRGL
jgi:hypothetical protein